MQAPETSKEGPERIGENGSLGILVQLTDGTIRSEVAWFSSCHLDAIVMAFVGGCRGGRQKTLEGGTGGRRGEVIQ